MKKISYGSDRFKEGRNHVQEFTPFTRLSAKALNRISIEYKSDECLQTQDIRAMAKIRKKEDEKDVRICKFIYKKDMKNGERIKEKGKRFKKCNEGSSRK